MSEAEVCRENGWSTGTVLRGHEQWSNGEGVWTTIRITAIGESRILAQCVRHERTAKDGSIVGDMTCKDSEKMWTLEYRDWQRVRL